MEAPNKIYLHGYPDKPFLCQDWDVSPTKRVVRGQQAENIAYIRKDALLEKIDDAIAHLSDGSLTGYYESLAYKDIRELIESM